MARLLLSSARMKGVWALLPLFASSGCLFLDVPNTPPAPVQIIVQTQDNTKGTPINFHADTSDAEDGTRLAYKWTVRAVNPPAASDPNCDIEEFQGGGADHLVAFYRPGMYEVIGTAVDSGGASRSGSTTITIDNAPPKFTGAGSAVQSSSYNLCGNNSAGQDITVHLDGGVQDDDFGKQSSFPGCKPTEALTYKWILTDWPGGAQKPVLTPFDGAHCAAATSDSGTSLVVTDPTAHVCVKTNSGPGTYTVELDVSDDGHAFIGSHSAVLAVGPDEPPCITGTEPVAGSYVVDRTQPQSFYVDGAVDDLDSFDAGIGYVWSVYRYADDSWRDVPSWSLSTYTLDLSSFGVGEKLRVRVEAIDRTGQRDTTCSKASDDCTPYSCVTTVCHKWKTWDLELR